MTLKPGEYKIVTQPEKSVIVNKVEKEAELANLQNIYKNLSISQEEIDLWVAEELEIRRRMYEERIAQTQGILDKINGN